MKKILSILLSITILVTGVFALGSAVGCSADADMPMVYVNYEMPPLTNGTMGERKLIITSTGAKESTPQVFRYRVTGRMGDEYVDFTVEIVGNGVITIEGMHSTMYTVTEITNDSWRYIPDSPEKTVDLYNYTSGAAIFIHTRNNRWLNSNGGVETN